MKTETKFNISRRHFLVSTLGAGAGLTLGVYLSGCSNDKDKAPLNTSSHQPQTLFEPNAFVRIRPDNSVTVVIKHLEMGQGTYTGLATLVAEELDAAWDQIKVESAPANAKLYSNLFWGAQGTGGSSAIANSYMQMRQAGATARAMLVAAAAKRWNVKPAEVHVSAGKLSHASGKSASFGELAEAAAKEPIPAEVPVKDPKDFHLIGQTLPRKDTPDKVHAKAIYTQDIKLPAMLTALVLHPPRFGARLQSVDDSEAKKIPGVQHVVMIPTGVAVVATDFWTAKRGRDALKPQWDESQALRKSSEQIREDYRQLAEKPGTVAVNNGDTTATFKHAAKTISAEYDFPFLAHATMEPMNCVVQLQPNQCELWYGAQIQTMDQMALAKLLNLTPEQIKINTLYAGGSFGRRANPQSDYVLEAANIAKALNLNTPIKLLWTREDDMRAGFYRPLYYHQIKAGLDKTGMPVAWQHRIVGQSILAGTGFESAMVKNGVDATSVEGASNLPYHIANLHVDLHSPTLPVPVQWWRSVGSTHNAYVVETFIDQLASTAKQDPVAYRRALLKDHPRHLAVLNLAAEKAGWDNKPLGKDRGRGIAVHESFNTFVAQVAEVTLHADKTFSVDRVVIAVDCGVAVNPDVIRAQMEGGMGYGLSAALSGKISLRDGQVEQSNFHDYPVLRMPQMPTSVEVYIVPSAEPPTGVGEPGTPVIAPALANAIANATGKRYYALPLPTAV
ncbi:MAG: xanthine dehydrogenase family protein molybdopterin-binding subunit [Gammaproteobacteria bacterium]|nr:xanthine dehydrogenase family protein molybdopterin-binding subunit [Gammaproteobacteria bacterium]